MISMTKGAYHPNSYLTEIKNVRLGLKARTRVLNTLEKDSTDARTVANEAGMHYGVVMHHLRLLEKEGIVKHTSDKPMVWDVTGTGQRRLMTST
jgi:predicted transcriptional regulator